MIKFKDLTIVVCKGYDGRLCGRGSYTVEKLYYFPNNPELHGKTIPYSNEIYTSGTFICNNGDKEIFLTTNNISERKLRGLLPHIEGAKLIGKEEVYDYKDDPSGRRVKCGFISEQKWDISCIYK